MAEEPKGYHYDVELFHFPRGAINRLGVSYDLHPMDEPHLPEAARRSSGERASFERRYHDWKTLPFEVRVYRFGAPATSLYGWDARRFLTWIGGIGFCEPCKSAQLVANGDGRHCHLCGQELLIHGQAVAYQQREIEAAMNQATKEQEVASDATA